MPAPSLPLGFSDSRVERVKYAKRDTVAHLLTADSLNIRTGDDGDLILELIAFSTRSKTEGESYRLTLGAEDRARLKAELRGRS